VARYVNRHFEAYIEGLKTPFFGRIVEFNESSSEMWTCPGHNGGTFYRRSPVGRVFYEYLGETVFRTDLDNSVVELGDQLVHEGAARAAEAAAAEVFGADRTYFVLNGTSMSNKVTAGALVARGDLVLFDRNNHKSSHHGALVLDVVTVTGSPHTADPYAGLIKSCCHPPRTNPRTPVRRRIGRVPQCVYPIGQANTATHRVTFTGSH
jgi:hypothetical protein